MLHCHTYIHVYTHDMIITHHIQPYTHIHTYARTYIHIKTTYKHTHTHTHMRTYIQKRWINIKREIADVDSTDTVGTNTSITTHTQSRVGLITISHSLVKH